jgi:hypothetical protein
MIYFPFGWAGAGQLRDELRRQCESISAEFGHPAWRGASAVTLWRKDGSGIRIFTQMHDIVPKLEVGVLNFELVSTPNPGDQIMDISGRFNDGVKAWKLTVTDSGATAESGVVIGCEEEIAVVAGGFPLTLALRGIEFDSPAFEPEYPWDRYQRLEL